MIVEAVVGLLLVASGVAALMAALGVWRLPDFFMRMHAPAICYTLGAWSLALASVIHFSFGDGRLALHTWLVVVILSITAPVTTVLVAGAGLFRARHAGEAVPPPLQVQPGTAADPVEDRQPL